MTETTLAAGQGRYNNLEGLRGIAALAVVAGHIERHKPDFGFKQLPIPFLSSLGSVAVTVFFVLSGFVITDMLLKEISRSNTIHIRHFYARRVLRIFPLYFLVLLLCCILYADSISAKGILLSVFFLPNVAFLEYLLPPILYPIWSIGVEEQFYAVHPFIMKHLQPERLPLLFGVIILVEIIVRNLYLLPVLSPYSFFSALHNFLLFARYDTILVGCIAAVYFKRLSMQRNKKWVLAKKVQYAAVLLFCLMLLLTVMYDIIQHEVYAFISAIIIINLCKPETSIISIGSKPFIFLGKISYGIYLLHKFALFAVLYLLSKLPATGLFMQNLIVYFAVTAAGIVLASLSYQWFERFFLRQKARYV